LQLSVAILTIFGINITIFSAIALVPIFFWELTVGLWMAIKGFNQSAPLIMKLKKENDSQN
jgi:hypothetical protein